MKSLRRRSGQIAAAALHLALLWAGCSRPSGTTAPSNRMAAAASLQQGDGQPASRSNDPMLDYFLSLPTTDATFSALDSEDAQVWSSFFNTFDGNVQGLRFAVQQIERELGQTSSALASAEGRLQETEQRIAKATAEFDAALRAFERAQKKSGRAASIDTQREQDRVERAREDRMDAASNLEEMRSEVTTLRSEASDSQNRLIETQAALTGATMSLGPPQLGAIANRELRIGNQMVGVLKHNRANDRIGIAECNGAQPIILIAARSSHAIANAALLFFREHELAHHSLGHIDCANWRSVRNGGPDQELQADCAAARVLASFPDGKRVVDIVFGHFFGWDFAGSATHPSTRKRANALYTMCT